MPNAEITNRLTEEEEQLKKLQDIVAATIKEEELVINNLLHPPSEVLTRGQLISDKVARFGGSWKFIISFLVIIIAWIVFNLLSPSKDDFDPFPFILLNLVLSCIAAIQAPIIMMSQNRQEEKDRKRAENDYLVNMKAELEIRSLQQKVDLLQQQQIKALYDMQLEQLEQLKFICDRLNAKGL
ncbi:DUF1003 domain-containing protein [Paraflavitalea sp. CAU 1676]|uniref:DUF1003 domain-containing protein n=1 Tax=Paraflavitalea sp. CAU 1676 TaxID=3032598 RepID=UPI0023DAC5D5|nr:DUF1003 domain-containing protein [Paraflavitalea sp. CAU 1676]MDF2189736.1 DUF1003 domain-containing protein [Paraflavitalea sp. CAU 1676]